MKKFFIALVFCVVLAVRSVAEEGMWLPLLLGQQVYNDMVKKGLKLTKDQLYNINKASLKDAIIIFGSGCTGEIVSSQGLIFTNHHCGYEAINGGIYAFTLDGLFDAVRRSPPTMRSASITSRIWWPSTGSRAGELKP